MMQRITLVLSGIVLFGLICFPLTNSVGAPLEMLNQTYDETTADCAYSLVETSDGGFALAGSTDSFGAGDADFWLVKTDMYGNMEWRRTYGGAMPTPEPTPTTWIAPAIVITAIVGVGLLVYFKKRHH